MRFPKEERLRIPIEFSWGMLADCEWFPFQYATWVRHPHSLHLYMVPAQSSFTGEGIHTSAVIGMKPRW
jgi:hypothetical protein